MPSQFGRSARWFATAAMCLVCVAGTTASAMSGADPVTAESVDQASKLLDQGQVVAAHERLISLLRTADTQALRERIRDLVDQAERKLVSMDDLDISLQKAEYALTQNDLRQAERQAGAVLRSSKATSAQKKQASDLMDQAAKLRSELAPLAAAALDQAVSDVKAGHYAEAKAGLASISRLGLPLDQTRAAMLNRANEAVMQQERKNGKPFEVTPLALGAFKPADAAAPEAAVQDGQVQQQEQPASTPPVPPAPPAPPAAAPEQTSTPVASSPAAAPQAGDNLFDQAATFDAQRVLREADAAYEAGRFAEAVDKYGKVEAEYARYLKPEEVARASERRKEAQVRLGSMASGQGADLMQQQIKERTVQRQEAEAVVANEMTVANAAISAGDPEKARTAAATAKLKWNEANSNGLLSPEQYRAKMSEIDALIKKIDAASEQQAINARNALASQLQTDKQKQEARARQERQQRINESLDRARALQAEQKYAEALQVIDEILFLEPNNPAALLLRDIMKDVVLYIDFANTQRDKSYSYAVESAKMQHDMIIPQELMQFPPDWPDISIRRGDVQSYTESPVDREVIAKLESKKMVAKFTDNSLSDVLNYIQTLTNINFNPDWDVLQEIGVEKDTKISLDLKEVSARTVLERVLAKASKDEFNRAGWAVADGIIDVSAEAALNKRTFNVIYDVRDLLFQVPDFGQVPQLDLNSVLNQGGGSAGGGSSGGGGGGGQGIFQDQQNQNNNTNGGPLATNDRAQLDRLTEIIRNNVDFPGWKDNGGSTGSMDELNGNLIIRNTSRNHREIQSLLNQLREVRNLQINFQSQFLIVAQDFFEQIGFDMDIYFNAQNNQYQSAVNQQKFFGVANQGGPSQGQVSVKPSDLVGTNGTNQTTDWTLTNPTTNTYAFQQNPFSVVTPSPMSIVPVQSNSDQLASKLLGGTQFAQDILALNPALGIAGEFLDDIQVDFLITATQADRRSVTLTAPRLTLTNGRVANIYVANQVAFISGLTPVVGSSAVAFDPQLSTANQGFTLLIRGVVSADRRYVTCAIIASIAQLKQPFRTVQVSAVAAGSGNAVGQPVQSSTGIELPETNVSRVQTGVTIPDQGTLLLGGQRLSTEVEVETGVPVLSKIPIINRLFTNRITTREEQTLIILLKPTIIIQKEEEDKHFPGLADTLKNPMGQ